MGKGVKEHDEKKGFSFQENARGTRTRNEWEEISRYKCASHWSMSSLKRGCGHFEITEMKRTEGLHFVRREL